MIIDLNQVLNKALLRLSNHQWLCLTALAPICLWILGSDLQHIDVFMQLTFWTFFSLVCINLFYNLFYYKSFSFWMKASTAVVTLLALVTISYMARYY